MIIGSLGSIPFYTSSDQNVMLSGIKWDSGARYSEHARHGQTDMLEYVGSDPDEISFDMKLSAFLGINPSRMLDRLRDVQDRHRAVKFVLGTIPIPGFWVLTDISRSMEHFHKDGTLLSVDVSVTLREYVERVTMPVITHRISFTNRMTAGPVVTPQPATPTGTTPTGTTPARNPSVPASSGTVGMSRTPVTNPAITAATVAKAATYVKKNSTALALRGASLVRDISSDLNRFGVVQALKKAFTTSSYPAVKAAPAKPVVVRSNTNTRGYTR